MATSFFFSFSLLCGGGGLIFVRRTWVLLVGGLLSTVLVQFFLLLSSSSAPAEHRGLAPLSLFAPFHFSHTARRSCARETRSEPPQASQGQGKLLVEHRTLRVDHVRVVGLPPSGPADGGKSKVPAKIIKNICSLPIFSFTHLVKKECSLNRR